MDPIALRKALIKALSGFTAPGQLRDRAVALYEALGYRSQRTLEAGRVSEFVADLGAVSELTDRQQELFECWHEVEFVFQVTDDEIVRQSNLFDELNFDEGRIESFLFLAVELTTGSYNRTYFAETTRVINRRFAMPVIILFQYGLSLTLAVVHRRTHKRDLHRDVLEKVTLVKDIRVDSPHRAHIDILKDLALPRLIDLGVGNFDRLHAAWETTLDIEELNRRFYKELFSWFERTVKQCRFPDDGAGSGNQERHAIRLITRLLFIWFLKEKGLVPHDIFDENFARQALTNHSPDRSDYYRAVLQNLFFATLNTEIDKRDFSKGIYRTRSISNESHHRDLLAAEEVPNYTQNPQDFNRYHYRDLLSDPKRFIDKMKSVPFVNGGLFDCLDYADGLVSGHRMIDAFTANITAHGRDLDVPARLFFDEEHGLFPLFRRYKFTVEENTPLDQEVALDPELLGRVFENLLAAYNPETRETARKATGSYNTPRRVVNYMVDEALVAALAEHTQPTDGDIEFWRARLRYLLDFQDAFADAKELFHEDETEAVIRAIASLKILDPAVGSGAFPMGVLHKLTLALRRLDPDNHHWEILQKELAAQKAAAAFDKRGPQARNAELLDISRTFDTYRQSDFGRKLYLMQNSIYGVDTQPIACQIAKLRFFISLVIEQHTNNNPDDNRGVRPLPNLETHFVAADTLIDLKLSEVSPLLHGDDIEEKRQEIEAIRAKYFLAHDPSHKRDLICKEKDCRNALERLLEVYQQKWKERHIRDINHKLDQLPNQKYRDQLRKREHNAFRRREKQFDASLKDARKIAQWDAYDQNKSADWFDPEYMFGVTDGFDIVTGNPPYIQLQKNGGALARRYKDIGYSTFARTGDIYQLFYEKACRLLKPEIGVLCYITSNSWLKAKYGKPLRNYLYQHHQPLSLLEMSNDVFENAIVDTCVLLLRHGGSSQPFPAIDMDKLPTTNFPPDASQWETVRPRGEAPWIILSSVEQRVLEKMYAIGTPLKEWDIDIYYGIKTGYNKAFLIDDTTKNNLVADDPNSAAIIKPVLRGRDIRRYQAEWDSRWLIDTHNGYGNTLAIDVGGYPAIKTHLDKFYPQLKKRRDQGRTPYNLRNCAYHEVFSKEKLVWIELVSNGRFAYDDSGIYCDVSSFIMTGDCIKYLCALLNSELICWFFQKVAPTSGMGTLRWKKVYVETIPIPHVSVARQGLFIGFIDLIMSATLTDPNADVAAIESDIDQYVYELYGLKPEEIAGVEKELLS